MQSVSWLIMTHFEDPEHGTFLNIYKATHNELEISEFKVI